MRWVAPHRTGNKVLSMLDFVCQAGGMTSEFPNASLTESSPECKLLSFIDEHERPLHFMIIPPFSGHG